MRPTLALRCLTAFSDFASSTQNGAYASTTSGRSERLARSVMRSRLGPVDLSQAHVDDGRPRRASGFEILRQLRLISSSQRPGAASSHRA